MIRNCCMLVAGLLLHTKIFAQDKTAASRTGEDYTLSNGAVEAVFSGSGSFDIEKLVLNGKQVIGAGKNETPWILIYKGPQGENPELKPEHAVYRGVQVRDDAQAKTLVFTWELTLDYSPVKYPVRMYVTLPDGGELLQWNIEADLPAGWLVTDLKFPNVVIERPEDGRIITTEGWGVEKPLDIATFEARYPSHASAMQFLVVHNAEGAFYYGTEDRRGCGKTYSAQCTPTTVALSDAIPASAGWIADGTFRLPWVSVTGFTPKGWEDAVVRWYRPFTFTTEWGSKPLASRNIPQWCYDADAWVRAKHVTDQTYDAVRRAARYFGQGLGVHWYFWHHYPYDTHYPDYLPAQERFAGMVRDAQLLGARVTPYINASIIVQLLTVAIPALENMAKEADGQQKMQQITRYVGGVIALVMSLGYYFVIRNMGALKYTSGAAGIFTAVVIIATFTAGAQLITWCGEQIDDKGIGNGISLLIFSSIVSNWSSVYTTVTGLLTRAAAGETRFYILLPLLLVLALVVIVFIVVMTNAERRITIQYAKRVVGRKQMGGQNSYLPLKLNMSGVMPIIFASAMVSIPGTIGSFLQIDQAAHPFWYAFFHTFNYTSLLYIVIYLLLILAFNYFYVAIQYNPVEIANNLRRNNGSIPGFRPGKPTSDFLTRTLNKITLMGAIFLAAVAVLPIILGNLTGMSIQLGGTSLLIVVGVALDTTRSLDSFMTMRNHKGFLG